MVPGAKEVIPGAQGDRVSTDASRTLHYWNAPLLMALIVPSAGPLLPATEASVCRAADEQGQGDQGLGAAA